MHAYICKWLINSSLHVGATTWTTSITGQIRLGSVQCLGNETRLIDCPANVIGSCARSAGVRCYAEDTSNCSLGAIRLRGDTDISGRVEICINNDWGTVCDNQWDNTDARVACVQLGLPSSG